MSANVWKSRTFAAFGIAGAFVAGMVMAPVAAAAKSGNDDRLVSYRTTDRTEIENLQRWVAAGHEDWCKDARLVAAEELKRIAANFYGDAAELQAGVGDGAKQMTFAWATLDGRVLYQVTVERFEWLLPIAKDADGIVWVPTVVEVQLQGSDSGASGEPSTSEAKATNAAERTSRS